MGNGAFAGSFGLGPAEVRVLGSLLEKQRTTPDMYPLTLNALRLACNQSTSRDPVVDYDNGVIRDALHRLERRGFARLASGQGSRAPKFRHLLAEALPMGEDEQAVMCVLMLRGPQTPGELKQRTERMHQFTGLDALHDTLARLIERGLAARLERRPGQKEERYTQLLEEFPGANSEGAQDTHAPAVAETTHELRSSPPPEHSVAPGSLAELVAALSERIASLEREVADLRAGAQPATMHDEQAATVHDEHAATVPADLYPVRS
jgi:uncharacterized protein YceH (UPF0502 family)